MSKVSDDDDFPRDELATTANEALVSSGALAPVSTDPTEQRCWLDCDLASLAEHRLGDAPDPRELDDAGRAWLRTGSDPEAGALETLAARRRYETPYWIVQEEKRVGTVALSTSRLGGRSLRLSSLYVFREARGRGVGSRALDAIERAFEPLDLGYRLETAWAWQRTIRFYLRRGLWVRMWKRELQLAWSPRTPPPLIDVGEHEASLGTEVEGESIVLARAGREGNLLRWEVAPRATRDERLGERAWDGQGTLALAIALRGWPLIRSAEAFEESRSADAGPPESLAYKIQIWEARDRARGFRVETARIPGLEYPTWAELQAKWDAEYEAYCDQHPEMRRPGK